MTCPRCGGSKSVRLRPHGGDWPPGVCDHEYHGRGTLYAGPLGLDEATMLQIIDPDCPADRIRCTWYEFRRDNIDGVDLEAVEAALVRHGSYTGGGGASPRWSIRRDGS